MKHRVHNPSMHRRGQRQLHGLSNFMSSGNLDLETFGEHFPGNLLTTDLSTMNISYMNPRGCEKLKHDVAELIEKGPLYFKEFFYPDEVNKIIEGYFNLQKAQNKDASFSFVHRVRIPGEKFSEWYFASAKLHYAAGEVYSNTILLMVNQFDAVDQTTKKIASLLEQPVYVKKNYPKFRRLSKREKEILSLIVVGNTTSQISDFLFLSRHTVNTHRKNIISKLEMKTNSELFRFAEAFNLLPDTALF